MQLLLILTQAARAIRRHKARAALNAVGIAVGVASVVWVVAIGEEGASRALDQLHSLGDNLVWVEAGSRNVAGLRTGTYGMRNLTLGDADAIAREVPQVRRVSPNLDGPLLVIHETQNWTTHYRGVSPEYLAIKRWSLAEGGLFGDEDVEHAASVCVLGRTVKTRLFGDASAVDEMVRVGVEPFRVVGVLAPKGQSATGQDQDDTLWFPYTTAMKKIRGGGQTWLDDILCSARSADDLPEVTAAIADLMRQRHHLGPDQEDDFNIRHPEELVQAQLAAARTLEGLLVSIASVALLVGGIGIMNVMLASVAERTREIGVRMAVGAPPWAIRAQFLVEAVLLTGLGGLIGLAGSVAGASALSRMLGWTLAIPPTALLVATSCSLLTGILFGYVPARRAAALDPIEALRSE